MLLSPEQRPGTAAGHGVCSACFLSCWAGALILTCRPPERSHRAQRPAGAKRCKIAKGFVHPPRLAGGIEG